MKRICALALYVLAVLLVACSEKEKSEGDVCWFEQPTVAVDGTNAEVSCRSLAGDNVLTAGRCGVVCIPVSDGAGAVTVTVDDPRIEQGVLYARVARLTPHTLYMAYAFLELSGRRMIGQPALFETGEASPEPEDPDNPDPDNPDPDNPDPDNPDPDNPDPDVPTPPRPGAYPGWPELPKMEERPGDYYYATHMCPAFTTASGVFENNLRSYTVCYSHDMMSGMWSAYPIHASYKGSTKRTDKWAFDPIVPQSVQPYIVSASYKVPGSTSPYSRGHLLASNDRTASAGMNNQTFFVTNMAPQWQNGFNSGVWSTLEDKTWSNVCADTLFVVSGVYFADTDTTVKDNASPQNTIYVPTHFYKVMIRSKAGNTGKPLYELAADQMQCIAFWFENKTYSGNSLAAYRTTVADVEQKTGLTFFVNVPEAPKQSDAGDWRF